MMTAREATVFAANRARFTETMQDNSLLVLFAGAAPHQSADAYYAYVANRNFYYVTGIDKPLAILLVTKRAGKVDEQLFIESSDPFKEKWEGKRQTAEEARALSGVERVRFIEEFETEFEVQHRMYAFDHLYLDLEVRNFAHNTSPAHVFVRRVQESYPFLKIENAYRTIADLRRIKQPEEIAFMREAIAVTDAGIRNMMLQAKPGMKEYELEAHFDFTLRSNGIKHHAFPSIVAGGGRATVLHYEANDQVVEDGSLLQIDLGAQYQHYNADISRVFPINGTFTERQKQIYNIVLRAELAVIEAVKPGLPFLELNEIAKRVLADGLKEIGLIEQDEELGKYYYHGVSHYIGLDTHDVGSFRDEVLQPGMVITVEPGLYIAEESIGIRIEDDILVTEDGHENLSASILKTIDEIEAFMAKE